MIKIKKILNEYADAIFMNGKRVAYVHDSDAYPFARLDFLPDTIESIRIGDAGTEHVLNEMPPIHKCKTPYGRLFGGYKVISFWIYPKNKQELMELIQVLNNQLKIRNIDLHIDGTWFIEIGTEDYTNMFIPIPEFSEDILKNQEKYKKDREEKLQQHVLSPLKKSKVDVPAGVGSKKGSEIANYNYLPGIGEAADYIQINKKEVDYRVPGAYPFGILYNDNIILGRQSSSHISSGMSGASYGKYKLKSIGRIWTVEKVVAFWTKYPRNHEELVEFINKMNEELKESDINKYIDDSWYIDVHEVLIPIFNKKLYEMAIVSPDKAQKEIESQKAYQLHIQSPLKKQAREIPGGLGSKKGNAFKNYDLLPGVGESIKENRMKIKKLLKESQEHKLALEMIRDLIKGTEWEGKVFLAGGAVRDELMGKDIKDLDITVAAKDGGINFATWLAKKLNIYKEESNPVIFPRFGTAKITLNGVKYKGTDLSKIDIETVMTRKEVYADPTSRKPDVDFGTPEQDAERRDLTINSLMKDLSTGEIKDFTGKGLEDLKNKVIRTPIDADIIFKEDPLRMLRAVRFKVRYGWKLPLSMIKALKSNAHMLKNISAERIQDELNKILMTDRPHEGIKLLQYLGLNRYIAPEFEKLVKMAQNDFHKWTADRHTYEVLKHTKPDIIVRLAAFFHDIGKGETRTEKDGKIHFYGHEMKSAEMARKIMNRLKYPNDVIDAVVVTVKNHMRAKSFGKDAELVSDKAMRKLMNDLGDHLEQTLDLIDADNKGHGPVEDNWPHNLPDQVAALRKKMKELGDFTQKLKIPVNGNDIIDMIKQEDPNFKPSGIIAKILDAIKDKFLENPHISREEAMQIAKETYRNLSK